MIIYKYLIVAKNGSVTLREREPHLAGNEIAVQEALGFNVSIAVVPEKEEKK